MGCTFIKFLDVDVTQNCIDSGSKVSPQSCPISLAIREAMPGMYGVETGACDVYIREPNLNYWYGVLPQKAVDFVDAFDDGKVVHPFMFSLTLTREELAWNQK